MTPNLLFFTEVGPNYVSRVRPGGPPFAADGKIVRITIGNGSGLAEAMRGQLVSERANCNIHLDTLRL